MWNWKNWPRAEVFSLLQMEARLGPSVPFMSTTVFYVGDDKDEKFIAPREKINQRFNIKKWQFLEEGGPLNLLGVELHKEKDGFTDRMDKYVQGIEPPDAPKGKPDTPLPLDQVTSLTRLVMKMRWPAQHTMPQALYLVSSLAQKVNHATISTVNEAIKVLNIMKEEVRRGHGRLWYRPIPQKDMTEIAAGSYALRGWQEGGARSSDACVAAKSKRSRVARSSTAAEACSICLAADRHLTCMCASCCTFSRPGTSRWQLSGGTDSKFQVAWPLLL